MTMASPSGTFTQKDKDQSVSIVFFSVSAHLIIDHSVFIHQHLNSLPFPKPNKPEHSISDPIQHCILTLENLSKSRLMAPSAFPDVCLKQNMTLADRLYNMQLIQNFCRENLEGCCHFSLEDMLYASSTLKVLLSKKNHS